MSSKMTNSRKTVAAPDGPMKWGGKNEPQNKESSAQLYSKLTYQKSESNYKSNFPLRVLDIRSAWIDIDRSTRDADTSDSEITIEATEGAEASTKAKPKTDSKPDARTDTRTDTKSDVEAGAVLIEHQPISIIPIKEQKTDEPSTRDEKDSDKLPWIQKTEDRNIHKKGSEESPNQQSLRPDMHEQERVAEDALVCSSTDQKDQTHEKKTSSQGSIVLLKEQSHKAPEELNVWPWLQSAPITASALELKSLWTRHSKAKPEYVDCRETRFSISLHTKLAGNFTMWHMTGSLAAQWNNIVRPKLLDIIEHNRSSLPDYESTISSIRPTLDALLIGKNESHIEPFVVLRCWCKGGRYCKAVRNLILKKHGILEHEHIGWGPNVLRHHSLVVPTNGANQIEYEASKPFEAPVRIRSPNGSYATLGGFLSLEITSFPSILFGLTVDHVFEKPEASKDDVSDQSWDSDDESYSDLSEEEKQDLDQLLCSESLNSSDLADVEVPLPHIKPIGEQQKQVASTTDFSTQGRRSAPLDWKPLGALLLKPDPKATMLDWAVTQIPIFEGTLDYNNVIQTREDDCETISFIDSILDRPLKKHDKVTISVCNRAPLTAYPVVTQALLIANPGQKNAMVYTLHCPDIAAGDSGSWACLQSTGELIGMVFASSPATGEVFVISARDVIDDIERIHGITLSLPASLRFNIESEVAQKLSILANNSGSVLLGIEEIESLAEENCTTVGRLLYELYCLSGKPITVFLPESTEKDEISQEPEPADKDLPTPSHSEVALHPMKGEQNHLYRPAQGFKLTKAFSDLQKELEEQRKRCKQIVRNGVRISVQSIIEAALEGGQNLDSVDEIIDALREHAYNVDTGIKVPESLSSDEWRDVALEVMESLGLIEKSDDDLSLVS